MSFLFDKLQSKIYEESTFPLQHMQDTSHYVSGYLKVK